MRRKFIVEATLEFLKSEKPLLARIISSSFYLSHGIRKDVILQFYFSDTMKIATFYGDRLKHVHVDEISLLGILKKIERNMGRSERQIKVHDGILLEKPQSPKLEADFIVENNGPLLEQVVPAVKASLSFFLPLTTPPMSPARGVRIRATSKPKPPDVTIAIVNIKLDRLA